MAGRDLAGDGMVAGGHVQSSVGIFRLFFSFFKILTCGPSLPHPKAFCFCHVTSDKWGLLSDSLSIGKVVLRKFDLEVLC
jgi:hypothetical protein